MKKNKENFIGPQARKDTGGAHKIERRAVEPRPRGWDLELPARHSPPLWVSLLPPVYRPLFLHLKDLPSRQETLLPQAPV